MGNPNISGQLEKRLMERLITDFLTSIEFGEAQAYKNMSIVPLFLPDDRGPKYITLREAFSEKLLTVTEVDDSGLVPELNVVNVGDMAVLLLGGEELFGAKQNRVLNTSILVPPGSEMVIPVSCTEQGRWFYTSDLFSESGIVLNPSLRKIKSQSVTTSLKCARRFHSDQDAVWNGIYELSKRAEFLSSTDALKDIIESRDEDLEKYADAFELLAGQRGLFVCVNGKTVGFDLVSRESAYRNYHRKLIKSYAMDAAVENICSTGIASLEKVKKFLQEAICSTHRKYRSRGLGWDYRFEGEMLAGSALVCEGNAVHMSFLSN